MDEMNLNLGSRWMRKLASKLIVKYLKKHFEVNTELDLDELKISSPNTFIIPPSGFSKKFKHLKSVVFPLPFLAINPMR